MLQNKQVHALLKCFDVDSSLFYLNEGRFKHKTHLAHILSILKISTRPAKEVI